MESIIGGVLLALIGFFLGLITLKKWTLFWDSRNNRWLRKYLGDSVTSTVLYVVSAVLIVVGVLLATGVIH